MGQTGKYVYGITASAAPEFEAWRDNRLRGHLRHPPIRTWRRWSATVKAVDYKHMRKDALAMLLVRHQKVLERIMELEDTIIPVRLGTFAADDARRSGTS